MTGQRGDELQQGSERPPRVVPRWVTAAVLALVVGGGTVAVFHDGGHPQADATPPPAPTRSPTPVLPSVDPLTLITSGSRVCTKTDHRRTLTVAFGVVNLSTVPVVVRKVTPLPGLRLTHQSIGAAFCSRLNRTQRSRVLSPRGSLVVLFTFALPKTCPAPFPVRARVTVSRVGGSRQVSHAIPVLNDLTGLEFDQC